jgi:hypothetical protein
VFFDYQEALDFLKKTISRNLEYKKFKTGEETTHSTPNHFYMFLIACVPLGKVAIRSNLL